MPDHEIRPARNLDRSEDLPALFCEQARPPHDSQARVGKPRPALTLVEVVLVLALLVIISAVVAPLLGSSMSRARLRHSGDLLQTAWGKARLAAMRSGNTYVFRYETQGNRYRIERLSEIATSDTANGEATAPILAEQEEVADIDIFRQSLQRLAQGVVFASGEVAAVPQLAAAAMAEGNGWSTPVLFYADGRTSDAVVLLANEQQDTLRVTLRGLTGISRAGEPGKEAVP